MLEVVLVLVLGRCRLMLALLVLGAQFFRPLALRGLGALLLVDFGVILGRFGILMGLLGGAAGGVR